MFCDALRLLDIAEHTGVETLAVFAAQEWAKVPLPLGGCRDRRVAGHLAAELAHVAGDEQDRLRARRDGNAIRDRTDGLI